MGGGVDGARSKSTGKEKKKETMNFFEGRKTHLSFILFFIPLACPSQPLSRPLPPPPPPLSSVSSFLSFLPAVACRRHRRRSLVENRRQKIPEFILEGDPKKTKNLRASLALARCLAAPSPHSSCLSSHRARDATRAGGRGARERERETF